jgi:hypothetical protein
MAMQTLKMTAKAISRVSVRAMFFLQCRCRVLAAGPRTLFRR